MAPQKGDRVRITYEADYSENEASRGHYVRIDGSGHYVPNTAEVTVVGHTYHADDLLDAAHEPPVGTSVISGSFNNVAKRGFDGWSIAGGSNACNWRSFAFAWCKDNARIIRVGDGTW